MPFARPPEIPFEANLRQAVGRTIRTLRHHTGISQEEFAKQSGIGRSYMGRLERGECCPTIETVYKFLPYLGVSFGWFARQVDRQLKNGLS